MSEVARESAHHRGGKEKSLYFLESQKTRNLVVKIQIHDESVVLYFYGESSGNFAVLKNLRLKCIKKE